MSENLHDPLDLAYLPNGDLNVPYLLANANVLLRGNELQLAASLFRLVKDHPKYGFCGDFGLGQCLMKAKKFRHAARAFEQALSKVHRGYIAIAHLDALKQAGETAQVQRLGILYAKKYEKDPSVLEKIRNIYVSALKSSNS